MSRRTCGYWNPLAAEQAHHRRWLEMLEGPMQGPMQPFLPLGRLPGPPLPNLPATSTADR
jgi:hypothetical protein